MSEEHEGGGGVEWNMAQLLNMELSNLTTKANAEFIAGHFREAVDCQIAKRMTAGFTFSSEERKKVEALETKFSYLIIAMKGRGSYNKKERETSTFAELQLRKLYLEYVQLLNDLLDKYNWFGARKKDSSRMKI